MKIMNRLWKEITRTPGPIRVQLLLLTTLTLSSVSSTGLLIYKLVSSTSDVNTLPVVESLEVGNEKLRLRVTGNATTEVLKNLSKTLKNLDDQFLEERSSLSTERKGG